MKARKSSFKYDFTPLMLYCSSHNIITVDCLLNTCTAFPVKFHILIWVKKCTKMYIYKQTSSSYLSTMYI